MAPLMKQQYARKVVYFVVNNNKYNNSGIFFVSHTNSHYNENYVIDRFSRRFKIQYVIVFRETYTVITELQFPHVLGGKLCPQ